MKQNSGYIFALVIGCFLGWLAQQFWSVIGYVEPPQLVEIEFNERRVQNLKRHERVDRTEVSESLNDRTLDDLGRFLASGDLDQVEHELLFNSDISPKTYPYITTLINEWLALGEYKRAVAFLYEIKVGLGPEKIQSFQALILDFVERAEVRLEAEKRFSELVEFYQLLVVYEADYVPFYLRLANWYIVKGELQFAINSLSSARSDVRYEEEVSTMEGIIQELELRRELITIPLTVAGEHYLANVTLQDGVELALMLDTGASMSVVKESLIQENWPEWMLEANDLLMNTANGQVEGKRLIVEELGFGGLSLRGVELGVLPLQDFSYDGLLGMNILKRFEFKVDQVNNVLLLKPFDI